jgi:hypothetical protein
MERPNGNANAKICHGVGELRMAQLKKSIVESIPVLVILGLLAGAIGGLGIGLIQLRAAASTASTAK